MQPHHKTILTHKNKFCLLRSSQRQPTMFEVKMNNHSDLAKVREKFIYTLIYKLQEIKMPRFSNKKKKKKYIITIRCICLCMCWPCFLKKLLCGSSRFPVIRGACTHFYFLSFFFSMFATPNELVLAGLRNSREGFALQRPNTPGIVAPYPLKLPCQHLKCTKAESLYGKPCFSEAKLLLPSRRHDKYMLAGWAN